MFMLSCKAKNQGYSVRLFCKAKMSGYSIRPKTKSYQNTSFNIINLRFHNFEVIYLLDKFNLIELIERSYHFLTTLSSLLGKLGPVSFS